MKQVKEKTSDCFKVTFAMADQKAEKPWPFMKLEKCDHPYGSAPVAPSYGRYVDLPPGYSLGDMKRDLSDLWDETVDDLRRSRGWL